MTQKETLAQIRALGMAARYSAEWQEWRVTLRAEDEPDAERREAIAYYTHDAEDALNTAAAMRATFEQQRNPEGAQFIRTPSLSGPTP